MNEITKQIFGTKSENDCVRVFEAFSGYGSQSLALKRLGLNFVNVGISEIDKYAIQAHKSLHGEVTNYGDISKVDWNIVPDFDLFTMSSPCTDFSTSGKQLGGEDGSGTRSSLLWECRRAIIAKKPKYILFENVKAITQSKFIKGFNKWQIELESYGYTNYAKVLNAKDFGVPQNRERLFMISIFNDDEGYEFPSAFKLNKKLKDILESSVDEKYYLRSLSNDSFITGNYRLNKTIDFSKGTGIIDAYNNTIMVDCSPTITTRVDASCCTYVQETNDSKNNIRKLTPRECFRLMGVPDDDINILLNCGISNSQLYKMSGNSIVVDNLYYIFKKLFVDKSKKQLLLF
ncbi:MAG: DNA cytosine methyltransferase [Bacteroidales bacterium]